MMSLIETISALKEENEQLKKSEKLNMEYAEQILEENHKFRIVNEQLQKENEQLKSERRNNTKEFSALFRQNLGLKRENEQLKNYFKKRAECSNFQINKLKEEIEELKRERDDWKSSTCSYMNKDSILSMDCQIVHEALWELEKEIEFGSKREDLFFDLKEKFEKLNNHRIGVF